MRVVPWIGIAAGLSFAAVSVLRVATHHIPPPLLFLMTAVVAWYLAARPQPAAVAWSTGGRDTREALRRRSSALADALARVLRDPDNRQFRVEAGVYRGMITKQPADIETHRFVTLLLEDAADVLDSKADVAAHQSRQRVLREEAALLWPSYYRE